MKKIGLIIALLLTLTSVSFADGHSKEVNIFSARHYDSDIQLYEKFPEYMGYYSQKTFTYNNIKQGNRNPLLYKNLGSDGLKTGHTNH